MGLRAFFGFGPAGAQRQSPVLLTDTLRLRAPRLEDQGAWSSLRHESRDFLQPWEPRWPGEHLSRNAFKRRIRWANTEASAGRAYAFLIFRKDPETLVGGITLSNVRRAPSRSASLGYWIGERYARQGYMRGAVEAVAGFAFGTLDLMRLEAACLEDNAASRALLERCAFGEEGVVRGYLEVNGVVRDHVLYSRIAADSER